MADTTPQAPQLPVRALPGGHVLIGAGAGAHVVTATGHSVRFEHRATVAAIEVLVNRPDGVTAIEMWACLWPGRRFDQRLIAGLGFDIRTQLGKPAIELPRPSNGYRYQLANPTA